MAGVENPPPPDHPNTGIGVVIVHFGHPAPTADALASVVDDPSSVPRMVVVVDNGDNLPPEFAPTGVDVLRSPTNLGYGTALNRGVGRLQALGSFQGYLCLNNDVRLVPGFLDAAAAALGEDAVGAVGGPIYEDGQQSRIWYGGGSVNFILGAVRQEHGAEAATRGRTVGFIPGTAMAVSSRAWQQLDGFDERYFLYHEDLDLCLRLRHAGWRLVFAPEMKAVHALGGATGSHRRSPLYLEHMTRTRLMPFRPTAYRLYLAVVHSGWVLARAASIVGSGDPDTRDKVAALLRGHAAALRGVFDS
jgi:N-acetylglucosaminyl-diphospho-decaprenol L-rhamnosyltransferase